MSELQVLMTITEGIKGRVEELIEGQRRIEGCVQNHETRITLLEHESSLCPYEPRIKNLESSDENVKNHELRISSLENVQTRGVQRWSTWEGRIIALLQAVIIVVLTVYLRKGGP